MDLKVKKLKVDISATPRKNVDPIIIPKAETNYWFPLVKEEDYFKMYCFKSTFLKH